MAAAPVVHAVDDRGAGARRCLCLRPFCLFPSTLTFFFNCSDRSPEILDVVFFSNASLRRWLFFFFFGSLWQKTFERRFVQLVRGDDVIQVLQVPLLVFHEVWDSGSAKSRQGAQPLYVPVGNLVGR